ncbi:MAG: hypothetical protein V3V08_20180 [Nannocystaceae bacterium]
MSSNSSKPRLNNRSYSRYNTWMVIGTEFDSMSTPWGGGGNRLPTLQRRGTILRRRTVSVSPGVISLTLPEPAETVSREELPPKQRGSPGPIYAAHDTATQA